MNIPFLNPTHPESEPINIDPSLVSDIVTGDVSQFDNEWVKFMSDLSKNKSVQNLVNYINNVHWSRRQRETIMAYCQVILGNALATTNFQTYKSFRVFQDRKDLIHCDLTVGLTRFDLTPEWNILLGMIDYHFEITSNMSKSGWFVERIGAQKHEIYQEEKTRDHNPAYKEKLMGE